MERVWLQHSVTYDSYREDMGTGTGYASRYYSYIIRACA